MSCDAFLDAADAIGRDIVADAIWHDGRCSWVGVAADPKDAWQPEYRALEPNLYDGTAGVGLFLAELAAVTGDAAAAADCARRDAPCAVAIAGRAARRGSTPARSASPGRSRGPPGCSARTSCDEGARELAAAALPQTDGYPDVVLGSAGSAVARLLLAEMFDDAGAARARR